MAASAGPAVATAAVSGPIRPLPKQQRRAHLEQVALPQPTMARISTDVVSARQQAYEGVPSAGPAPLGPTPVPRVIRDDSPLPILVYMSRADVGWPWQPPALYRSGINPLAIVSPQDIAASLWHASRTPRGPQWWHATLKSYVHFYPEHCRIPLHPNHN
eukprot:5155767-Amphidinium_carterae.1